MSADSMLGKVRALLTKAEDRAATPAEAEAYTAKAAELIARYGLEEAIAHAAASEPVRFEVADRIITVPAPYARIKAGLLHAVARSADAVRAVTITGKVANGGVRVHLFGTTADLDRVELLFTSLLVQAGQQVAAAWADAKWSTDEGVRSWKGDWLEGFTRAIAQRLKIVRLRAKEDAGVTEGSGAELVLLNKDALVKQSVDATYPRLRAIPGRRITTRGFDGGYAAGQRANLGGTEVSRATGRALSGGAR
ncbi:DUF2786 domain-containing protein [Catenuloplanes atrovinosus]|uniref:DUF2786 domain-containing protein n=1 Tax=Catenuloplanes atrovinosus TaxID=137266 RepID=A0AAE3YTE5_9ACTN|nr:DUF2786 domain-containing protein [Catenuloplanes atrovinosus]MDR7278902.1 hypothetical protein [Catenuloplanes atrovinosus]